MAKRCSTQTAAEKEVFPRNPKKGFTLDELYWLIGCSTVQAITLADGRTMWMDEEAKLSTILVVNEKATDLLLEAGGMPDDFVVGKVLISTKGEVR